MNLSQWLEYLEQCHPSTIELGLERVAQVAARLDIGFGAARVITVGGTNGKGSTVRMLETILEQAGYRTCCYTSPHLLHYNERVRLDGRLATDAELCKSFAAVEAARAGVPLTYFEFGTLAALQLFAREQPDFIILEVGLGGRLDAVNIVDADLAIVTNVDLDHTDWLGDTREAIGFEKAGIFRPDRPALIGEINIPASVPDHARRIGARIYANGTAFRAAMTGAGRWCWTGTGQAGEQVMLDDLPLNDFPLDNGAAVLQAVTLLAPAVTREQVCAGLTAATLPGRFQQVDRGYRLVLDVAHNPHAVRRLVSQVQARFPGHSIHVVVAMLADKDYRQVLALLGTLKPAWYTAGIQEERGLEGKMLYNHLLEIGEEQVHACTTITEAFAAADQALGSLSAAARQNSVLLVTGSFYTVAAVMEMI